jgi:hypothetical protein
VSLFNAYTEEPIQNDRLSCGIITSIMMQISTSSICESSDWILTAKYKKNEVPCRGFLVGEAV